MARKPETLSEVLQARRKRRRAAQRHFDNLAALPPDAIDPLSMLPSDAYDSLQARLKKSAAQPDCGVWVDKLTLDQQRALAALKKAADALNEAAAARDESDLLPEEVAEDEPLRKLIARRDRAVRRVIKLGLERHSDAISIVRAWLAHPHRTVPKGSRERLGVSRAKGQRKDMTLEDVWLEREVRNILVEKNHDPAEASLIAEEILRELIARHQDYAVSGGPFDKRDHFRCNCSPLCGSLTRVDGIECGLPG